MKYYKVVALWANELCSVFASGKSQIRYEVGRWVKAPRFLDEQGYYPCVFNDLQDAVNFKSLRRPWAHIYECEVRGAVGKPRPALSLYSISRGEIMYVDSSWVKGTLMAREVKLVRLVTGEEIDELG